jgi:hypothetical protein
MCFLLPNPRVSLKNTQNALRPLPTKVLYREVKNEGTSMLISRLNNPRERLAKGAYVTIFCSPAVDPATNRIGGKGVEMCVRGWERRRGGIYACW